jgi:hypothetical protein
VDVEGVHDRKQKHPASPAVSEKRPGARDESLRAPPVSVPESPGLVVGGLDAEGASRLVSSQKPLLGKMARGVVTGGFDAGYFFECEVGDDDSRVLAVHAVYGAFCFRRF